ncbi:Sterile alpha motif domain-containing protein 3 [Collichthys lucidus]|uniref:Sterile alpha motif domain-containing protein 3 n=1 Tax=Collichthys lucidus TaxID=240159 RepID=A0A4U5TXD4_COLLU|nr:Sterile alpha motif domain-containing protein 3 [Collichthys lucidus]
MAAPQKFVLRVCVATDVAMKLILTERPQSVEELKNIMQEKFKPRLDCDFTLQYEDPDFNGQLSVLMDIQELPEKGTLKVVRSESDVSSTGSSDTDILPHVPLRQRQKNWPDCFPVPTFSYEVEHVCAQGNAAFESSGKTLKLTRAQKHNILENMAETMYNFKPYPHDKEVGMAAEALVTAHPCLREHGSKNGWKVALKFKMGNYRTRLARSGCVEVSVNAGKRSRTNPENDCPHSNIKRARRAEVNYLPNFPRGENETTLEEMRVQIIQETEKTERDQILIEKLMHTTFALRRQHIVQGSPQVREFLENWPALRMQSQVFAEFHRITNVNLRNQFYYELDRYTPKLAALYRQKSSRTGKGAEALREMLRIYDLEEEHDINMRRTLALRALPVYLREDDTEFFKTCNGEDEVEIIDTQLALLSVVPDSIGSISFSPENISIVIEDEVVISELPRLADAFVVLFGLIYALHLDYPKKLTHTFTFIQKVLMCLDDNKPLKPCLLSLKNDLLKE